MSQIPHRIINSYCDLYYVIGALQGYAGGLDMANPSAFGPNLKALKDGLLQCAVILEKASAAFGEEYGRGN